MITFKQLLEKKMKGEDPCWDDYEMVGMKEKNGKKVPNCVPKQEGYVSDAQRKAVWAARNEKGVKEEVELEEGQVTSKELDSGAHDVFYNGKHIGTVHSKKVQWFGGRSTNKISAKYHTGEKVDVNPDNKGRTTLDSAKASLVYHHLRNSMKEEAEINEAKIPVEHAVKAVTRVLGSQSAARFATHLKPGTEKHTSWDKVNDALKKQGVKPKHIADISVHVRPTQYEEVELEEEQDSKHYEIYDTKTSKTVHSFKANHMSHANIKADDWLESNGKTGKGLKVRPVNQGVKEEVDLDEAVSVEHDRYMRSHGKKASGTGTWMFTHKRAGDVDYKNDKEVHQARGSFSDAAKSAKAWAKSHGHSTVYVMEEVEIAENQVWKGHSSTVKNPNFNDELSIRRVNPVGKRLKSGKLSADEKGSQERLKSLIKFKREKGGLTGPQGTLPEEVELEEASDTKRPPNFTMHPIDRQDYKILKDPKKKPLPKASKEWGRDGGEKKMKEEVELDESGFADDFLKMVQKRHPQAKLTTGAEKKKEAEDLMKKRVASGAKPAYPHPGPDKYPLGGYDPVSKRSYSEETEVSSSKLIPFSDFISK